MLRKQLFFPVLADGPNEGVADEPLVHAERLGALMSPIVLMKMWVTVATSRVASSKYSGF